MTVETNARFISQLNETYPRDKDLIKEGDNHIRLTKSILKNTFPGFNSSVKMSSDKLNKIEDSLTFEGASPVFQKDVKFGTDKRLDMNGNRITNLKDPVEDTDAVSLKFVKNSIGGVAWPVGSVFLTINDANPETLMGFGKWMKIGGRMLVGAGIGTDTTGAVKNFKATEYGGNYNHKISVDELPNHNHVQGAGTTVFSSDAKMTFPSKVGDTGQLVCTIPVFRASGPCKVLCRAITNVSGGGSASGFGIWVKVFNSGGGLVGQGSLIQTIRGSDTESPSFEFPFSITTAGDYKVEAWGYNSHTEGSSILNYICFSVSEVNA